MEDSDDPDVPQILLEMLRIFLAASKRGDHASLILDTRRKDIVTKYRSVEQVAGVSATTNTPSTSSTKRMNPARARRSLTRLEKFKKKKEAEKLRQEKTESKAAAGESSSRPSQLVIDHGTGLKKAEETWPHSPIPKVDGQETLEKEEVSYTFKSEYGEEDILHSLGIIFPPFVASLDSRVRLGRREADHQQCIVSLRNPFDPEEIFLWPEKGRDDDVFRYLKLFICTTMCTKYKLH
jgi:hypothetical protein